MFKPTKLGNEKQGTFFLFSYGYDASLYSNAHLSQKTSKSNKQNINLTQGLVYEKIMQNLKFQPEARLENQYYIIMCPEG
jgi:hypothetical protein